ncbi:MAG: Alpha-L-glutamate ligase, RimK family [Candidatus Woesebacteria bacterium GW2011_GWA1_33_30]|uniref:Alpha-L-glutamate ligase, RimK family n=1 Tax=Candidatus Woesebacteria bacterium GW2011_GWA2_33_28 TaxID=1618561 RepID=A0A0F9ZUI5_9BACT|nr:MAG: Alpha-L-glutamate ligase, RimK family [Candidatus Woesebacteria bacterium GW2011_GWA2_33_28]KKP48727.1 MAG: Alpha-L-glutamate ligase, RimK family [Candidatus Woesebacteria bacterium GW2011_GWA1_33_30]KKP50000.1 MAG: Alpha-L-glutamate ligase, RimK family [Microgenomates group bacterium GW2011_GWC1_33_32]KKP51771.1 MAG: Alpha-L-glutamate ligase, RimK family [Candidatus Woesebacteria bacterium GW2011_GWB1_33_38]KKP58615.1 MAG: Alpha-L-glutamate ligase, RimK family [Microgenomates group bac
MILREPNPKKDLYRLRDKVLRHYLNSNTYVLNSKSYLKWSVLDKKTQELEFQKAGFDLRVIVIDSKVVGIMKRTPRSGEFLSNFSKRIIIGNIAVETARRFKLDYVGVDIMLGNGNKWKVLEVNRACQFKGFEKALKINVAKEVTEFFN